MSVEYREGDLFMQPDVQALAHGVNCEGVMGAGIAVAFKQRYPDMYIQYRLACSLGTLKPGGVFAYDTPMHLIFNIASQDKRGANARYDLLSPGLAQAMEWAEIMGISSIALPRIGAGIGGLEWQDVKRVFETQAELHPSVDLIVVSLPGA